MSAPAFCMINPAAGKDDFTAFLLRDGVFWAAKAEPAAVKRANGWLDSWNAEAQSLRLDRIQKISGAVDDKALTLTCVDDAGKYHDIQVKLANRQDRDLMRNQLLVQLGHWSEAITHETRGVAVAKGVIGFAACLCIAWLIAGLSGGSVLLPSGWGFAAMLTHGAKSALLAQVVVAFSKAIGPTLGLALAGLMALLGAVVLVTSFFMKGEALFEHNRPAAG